MNKLNIELVDDGLEPKCMSSGASAYDVFARQIEMTDLNAATIKLGFKLDLTSLATDCGAILMPRSGWGTKHGFRMLNTIGLIDMDYRGEVMLKCEWNVIPPDLYEGARVAQLLIIPILLPELQIVDSVSESERGEGGFGSTGHE